MRIPIGDTYIRLAHPWPVVISNGAYLAAGLVITGIAGSQYWTGPTFWLVAMASFAFIVQAYGSILFHGTPGSPRWARLLDAVGIQMVMTATIGVAVHVTWDVSAAIIAPVVFVGWILWWFEVNRVRRNVVIGVEILIITGLLGYAVSWVAAGLILAVTLVALAIWYFGEPHTIHHALWHLLSAVAQAASVICFL